MRIKALKHSLEALAQIALCFCAGCSPSMADLPIADDSPLRMPEPGSYQLRVITPSVLELTLITTKAPDPAPIEQWNFVAGDGRPRLPKPQEFTVLADSKTLAVTNVGFKRRVLYAPLKKRDLRIGNYLYLQLAQPIATNQTVEVKNPTAKLWKTNFHFIAKMEARRWSPAIHINQVGYLPSFPKKAMVGYYLGSAGELELNRQTNTGKFISNQPEISLNFQLVDAVTGREVFQGGLLRRSDKGFPFPSYQEVFEADFTQFKVPGEYQLVVPGLGASFPFFIDEGIAAAFARTYALGLYHQRCGTANELPFTRHTHAACHTAPAEVPTKNSAATEEFLEQETADYTNNVRHTARPLKNFAASLYPFVNKGKIDVSGGHHDAGDYSKYTCNSAGLIHQLIFAVDVFPGVRELDNLGIPESGDGKSDVLQEAKWEADFLAKMQDADGGFYFLVYPRDRRYEDNVTPDKGDSQIVWPKNTAVTAAAVAALAQCSSSPAFKEQFPEAAALYLSKAKKGWAFLEHAIAAHGKDGAYQKITHYGDPFMHDDEMAWAACEMFLATGEPRYEQKLIESFNPADPNTRKWGWWRLYEAYGCAIRSYAFAAQAGKLKREKLHPNFLAKCEEEINASGHEQLERAQASAYGTSFPIETKRTITAGWFFSSDAAFDLAVASQLDYPVKNDPRPKFLEAILSNLNYEAGCNPVNVTYLTGLGWKRQREIVHQYAQNDRRVLPPSGIPLGNLQGGFGWLDFYQQELGALTFPRDDSEAPYPIYDRWGDSFNLSQEFVVLNQARGLAYLAFLMARTPLKNQPWKSANAQISEVSAKSPAEKSLSVSISSDLDLRNARIVWESENQEPAFGKVYTVNSKKNSWIETEVQLADGRRVFAITNSASLTGKGTNR